MRTTPTIAGLCVALAGVGASCAETLVTRGPPVAPRAPALPELAPSHVTLRVEVDFGPAFAGVDALVPRSVGPSTRWEPVGDGAEVLYEVRRGPIRLAVDGDTLVAETDVAYAIRARKQMLVMLYFQCGCAGESWCGGANEGRRQMTLRAETRLRWHPEWHLTAQTTVPPPRSANDCVLGWGPWSRNMTPLIQSTVQRELGDAARRELDARVPLLTSIQSQVARGWAALHEPIPIDERRGLWLSLSPSAIELAPVDGRGEVAAATAFFTTAPRLIRGARPDAARAPFPVLATGTPASDFRLAVRGHVPFASARETLRAALVERRFPADGAPHLEVTAADLYGSRDDVVLRLEVTGEAEGAVYLRGRAQHDAGSDSIVLADLEYTADTSAALDGISDWTARDELLAAAARASRFAIRDTVERTRARLTRALDRELGPGVRLSATLRGHRVTAIGTDRTGFAIVLELDGNAELALGAR